MEETKKKQLMFFLNYLEDCEKESNSKTLLDACY